MSKEKKLEQTQASESNVIEQRLKDSRKAQSANPKKGKKRERKSRYNDKRVQDPIFGKDFKRFKPKAKTRDDVMLTLEMNNIPDKVDGVDIKRQLAKEGVHVMDVDIKNDLLTDKRTGKGEIKLRMSKGKQKMVKEKIEGMGIRSLVKKYKNIPK